MLAAFTTKLYNTGAQIHKKHKKEKKENSQLVYKLTKVHVQKKKIFYHGLRGSASPVLTATGFVNGRGQFLTPNRIHTP